LVEAADDGSPDLVLAVQPAHQPPVRAQEVQEHAAPGGGEDVALRLVGGVGGVRRLRDIRRYGAGRVRERRRGGTTRGGQLVLAPGGTGDRALEPRRNLSEALTLAHPVSRETPSDVE